jgi:hypothetical protein
MSWDDLGPRQLAESKVQRSLGEIIVLDGKKYRAVEDRMKRDIMGDCRGCAFFVEEKVTCNAPRLTCGNFIWHEIRE